MSSRRVWRNEQREGFGLLSDIFTCGGCGDNCLWSVSELFGASVYAWFDSKILRGILDMVDRLVGLVRDVSSASGVVLRGPVYGRVVVGRYEAQVMSRKTVTVECLNAHGEWEVLIQGKEEEVWAGLTATKRVLDIQLQKRFTP
jgi:hypothetical protein